MSRIRCIHMYIQAHVSVDTQWMHAEMHGDRQTQTHTHTDTHTDTQRHTHTLGSVICTHGWMPTRDITTLAAQAHCNVRCKKQIATTVHKQRPSCRPQLHAKGVFAQRGYHKMAPCTACTIKASQTLLQVEEDDQSSLPMSLVASLDTVPVTCCVPKQGKLIKGHETVEAVEAATDGL